ncbi:hypothetical protein ACFE04_024261 [Oxalis oulophora]
MDRKDIAFVVGVIGNVISILGFLLPAPQFTAIFNAKAAGSMNQTPYVIACISDVIWIVFATVTPAGYVMLTVNAIGLSIYIAYLSVFVAYSNYQSKRRTLVAMLLSIICLVAFFVPILFIRDQKMQNIIISWTATGSTIISLVPSICTSWEVYKKKDLTRLPLLPLVFSTASSLIWLLYGCLDNSKYIIVAYSASAAVDVVQLGQLFL